MDQIHEALVKTDVVISVTGAPHLILTHELLKSVMRARSGRPILLVDIALPRDIEPTVVDLPGVSLINIDALHDGLETARQARLDEVPRVEEIVHEEMNACYQAIQELRARPVIRELRLIAETIRQRKVERTLKHLLTNCWTHIVSGK